MKTTKKTGDTMPAQQNANTDVWKFKKVRLIAYRENEAGAPVSDNDVEFEGWYCSAYGSDIVEINMNAENFLEDIGFDAETQDWEILGNDEFFVYEKSTKMPIYHYRGHCE